MKRSCPDGWLRLRLASLRKRRPQRMLGLTKEVRHYETVKADSENPGPACCDRPDAADMDMLWPSKMFSLDFRARRNAPDSHSCAICVDRFRQRQSSSLCRSVSCKPCRLAHAGRTHCDGAG